MSLRLLESTLRMGLRLFGRHREEWALSHLAEHLAPEIVADVGDGRTLTFYGYGTYVPWCAVRILKKEPETIEWIDSFEPGGVLWDIGANIGVYTLYAALRPGVQVVAFEPVAGSYMALTRSIGLNDAHDRVAAYCLGISDTTGATRIYLEKPGTGSSGHAMHDPVNGPRGAFQSIDEQAVMSASIDDLASSFDLPFPNNIKVDVDGLEDRVVRGGLKTLKDPRLKSILIEVHGEGGEAERLLGEAGLVLAGAGKLNKIYRRP